MPSIDPSIVDEIAPEHQRILVVDDDRQARVHVSRVLESAGFQVHVAGDATEAWGCLEPPPDRLSGHESSAPDAAPCFSAMLLDLRMPGRDGFWLLDRVVETDVDMATIMLTSVDSTPKAVECLQRGASDYLIKPINSHELVVRVRRALDKRELILQNREYRERATHQHSQRVAHLSVSLARRLGISNSATLDDIRMGAYLHDIGKIGVPTRFS